MAYRLFLGSRCRLSPSILIFSTPFVVYGIATRQVLRNDAADDLSWPSKDRQPPTKSQDLNKNASLHEGPLQHAAETWFGDNDLSWSSFSEKFSDAGSSLASFQWSSVGDKIADLVIPAWAVSLPAYVRKLQLELSAGPGSLTEEIIREAEDPTINPEIGWSARVRTGSSLSPEERAFQKRRKQYTRRALARYLGIPEEDIHPEDVPTIAMCGSGGGLRALVAGCGSYLCTQQDGLFDCVTYTAGVSGSCWLQTLFHSSLGHQNFSKIIAHLKRRVDTHIAFPPAALNLLTSAPTNKFLLSGLIEKARADPSADFGLVDIYGLLLAARLLVPRGELEVEPRDLKLSNQRAGVDSGAYPLPIYTAVRHEIPLEDDSATHPSEEQKEQAKRESWFQWFEWTPHEFWCEEVNAGIPTWSLGRQFRDGVDIPQENGLGLPEMRLPQLLGIWGSAFCATLSHYYKEIRPLVKGITGFGGIDELISERNEDLVKVHPIDPATIPNFILGLDAKLPPTTPRSMLQASHLQLMDAGMSNNLPIYPLLRPGRDVDIIIAFDASADIRKENWLSLADGYAKQRGIKGWPLGAGWPREDASEEQTARELEAARASSIELVTTKTPPSSHPEPQKDKTDSQALADPNKEKTQGSQRQKDLGYCTIWIGATQERSSPASASNPPPSKRLDSDADWSLLSPSESADMGIAVIYFPLIPNPSKCPGLEPDTTPFMSTWNSVYTAAEIDSVVALARANYGEGAEQTRRCVRAVYERKKRLREEREAGLDSERWRRRFKGDADHFRGG